MQTVRCCTELYMVVQNCTLLYRSVHCCTELYTIVKSCTLLYKVVHCCTEAEFQLDDTHTHTRTDGH